MQGRAVTLPEYRNGVARASFADLCGRPLGPADYLAIADAVDVLILDDIPVLSRARNNEAKRFVTLIDALYEAKVRLVVLGRGRARRALSAGRGRLRVRPHRLAPPRDAQRRLGADLTAASGLASHAKSMARAGDLWFGGPVAVAAFAS